MGINRNNRINRVDINRNDSINKFDRFNKGCKCCHGSGTQRGKDGINIFCPCCHGSGKGKKPEPYRRFT
jgi:hypothetical protein